MLSQTFAARHLTVSKCTDTHNAFICRACHTARQSRESRRARQSAQKLLDLPFRAHYRQAKVVDSAKRSCRRGWASGRQVLHCWQRSVSLPRILSFLVTQDGATDLIETIHTRDH